MSVKVLLIGCGNIGAGYDFKDETKVWTHARAYSFLKDIELSIFDQNAERAREVAAYYEATFLEELDEEVFKKYDLISITTPTTTHYQFLSQALQCNVPCIICEKPVVSSVQEADELLNLYNNSDSKVLVNYIRRFQPAYAFAKQKLQNLRENESLKGIIIKYKRGFLNNASHAVDLLEFLFDQPFMFTDFKSANAVFDAFEYDPTLSGNCTFLNQPVSFLGLADTTYPIFEIEIFFGNSKININNSGDQIKFYTNNGNQLKEDKTQRQTDILRKYMVPVVEVAFDLLKKNKSEDNFISSLELNKRILQIIESINKKSHATISN